LEHIVVLIVRRRGREGGEEVTYRGFDREEREGRR
jgi:hypothetical protein